ncbi:MAG TPA: SIMPL domain-containing protein [Symbiobacteriaceae bacterium]
MSWAAVLVLSVLLVGAVVFRPHASLADNTASAPTPNPRTLDVTGQGKLTAKYDTAAIALGFTTQRDMPTAAYQDMSDAMNKVVVALKAMGIKDDDLKTGTFSLNAQYDWNNGSQKLVGYQSTNTLTITTQALDKVPALMEAAVSAGANQIQGVSFSIKNTDELLNQALDEAVADARAKADRVAGKLGTQVIGVLKVVVQDNGRAPIFYEGMAADSRAMKVAAAPAPVFSGSGDYSANVSVTFELK